MPKKEGKRLQPLVTALVSSVVEEDWSEEYILEALVEPGNYKKIDDLVKEQTKGKGRTEVIELTVSNEIVDEPGPSSSESKAV